MTIQEIFYKLLNTPEDEYHDFKQQWYDPHNRAELVKDIFSFVNTLHHQDCYLIIGVNDQHSIVGIEKDENRLNTQQLTDFIHRLPIANSHEPKVIVDTFSVVHHQIDIITIQDTDDVPVYLAIDKKWPPVERTIGAGQIFSRVNENNTAMNGNASDWTVEQLWKKRFGLDIPIQDRYTVQLKDISHWEYLETDNKPGFLYDMDPDYYMYLEDVDNSGSQAESYSLGQISAKMDWHNLVVTFRNRTIRELSAVYLDGCRLLSMTPVRGAIGLHGDNPLPFVYFLEDSFTFAVENFLSNISADKGAYHSLYQHIVIFKDEQERDTVINTLTEQVNQIRQQCTPTMEQIQRAKNKLSLDFSEDDREMDSNYINRMCLESNVSQYIKQYVPKIAEDKKS